MHAHVLTAGRVPVRRRAAGWCTCALAAFAVVTISGARAEDELAELFTPPTDAEITTVRTIWDARDPTAYDWAVEFMAYRNDFEIWIVSHVVNDEYRHYGAVRFPRDYRRNEQYPVLLKCHGDFHGADDYDLAMLDGFLPSDCLPENYIIVVPSYRGEGLDLSNLGFYQSEGPLSPNNFDVDDSIALLDGVLCNIPQADATRVATYGTSRGGTVALRVGVREPRVKLVISLYGQSDYFLPSLQAQAEDILFHGGQAGDPVIESLMNQIVLPWSLGAMTTGEARLAMLLRSTAHFVECFAEPYPQLHLHHGILDGVIPVEQSDRMAITLLLLGARRPGFAYYRYPNGIHAPESLTGAEQRIDAALCRLANLGGPEADRAGSDDRTEMGPRPETPFPNPNRGHDERRRLSP